MRMFPDLFISLMVGGAVFCLGAAVVSLLRRRDPAVRRIEGIISPQVTRQAKSLGDSLARRTFAKFLARLARPAKPKKEWELSKIQKDLLRAGFHSKTAVNTYLGIKMGLTLVLPLLIMLTPIPQRLPSGSLVALVLIAAAGFGYVLPGFFLDRRTQRRQEQITRELPEVLDLLVIAVESGLGLDGAIKRVSEEVAISCPALAGELTMVSLELQAGIVRTRAFKNLAERCGVDEVTSLVNMLNQADRFGVSVGNSLRVHSDTVRTKWRQKMEEKAAKVPLKLLFPVLFLIFPAIMVVMAGPAIIRVSESILK